jgi:[CysO sulfur-carrier protein]-S-L-cysteine hydrolase
MDSAFSLEKNYADEIITHARAESPNECCGIMVGTNGRVIKHYPTTNSEQSPFRYSVDPRELIAIYREIQEKGWDILAIYHSHTHTEAYPSPTDIELAFLPAPLYLIISLTDPNQPVIKGFHIREGKISEVELRISES